VSHVPYPIFSTEISDRKMDSLHTINESDSNITPIKYTILRFSKSFVEGNTQDVVEDFQNLMKYCATDVLMTADISKKIMA